MSPVPGTQQGPGGGRGEPRKPQGTCRGSPPHHLPSTVLQPRDAGRPFSSQRQLTVRYYPLLPTGARFKRVGQSHTAQGEPLSCGRELARSPRPWAGVKRNIPRDVQRDNGPLSPLHKRWRHRNTHAPHDECRNPEEGTHTAPSFLAAKAKTEQHKVEPVTPVQATSCRRLPRMPHKAFQPVCPRSPPLQI